MLQMNFEYPDFWKERDNKKNLNINEKKLKYIIDSMQVFCVTITI